MCYHQLDSGADRIFFEIQAIINKNNNFNSFDKSSEVCDYDELPIAPCS